MKPDNAMVQVLTSKLRALEVAYSLAEALQKTLRDAGLCFDGVTSVMEGVSASLADVQGALRGCDHPVEPNGLSCARCGGPGVPHRSEEVPPPDPMPGAAQAELDRQARLVAPQALDRRCGCPAECRPAAPEAPRETPTDMELTVQQGALEDAARALAHALDRAETTPEDRRTLELALGVLRRNSGEVARALKFRAECAAEDAR